MSDWPGLIVAYVYVFGATGAVCHWRGYSPWLASRVGHIAVGMWIVGTVLLFQNRFIAVLPLLSLALFNFVIYLYRRYRRNSYEAQERNSLGAVYLPLSLAFMALILWEQPGLLVASLMPLIWGDALAAIMGHYCGQYHYQVLGHGRTLEGSLSMFLFSLISLFLALVIFPPLGFWPSLLYSFITAVVATGVEAASPWGMDNLFVPVVSGALLRLLAG
jgi:phytol kinase